MIKLGPIHPFYPKHIIWFENVSKSELILHTDPHNTSKIYKLLVLKVNYCPEINKQKFIFFSTQNFARFVYGSETGSGSKIL